MVVKLKFEIDQPSIEFESSVILYGKREYMRYMQNITKALQDLAKTVENNLTVKSVKVTVTLQKPKSNKAKTESK